MSKLFEIGLQQAERPDRCANSCNRAARRNDSPTPAIVMATWDFAAILTRLRAPRGHPGLFGALVPSRARAERRAANDGLDIKWRGAASKLQLLLPHVGTMPRWLHPG